MEMNRREMLFAGGLSLLAGVRSFGQSGGARSHVAAEWLAGNGTSVLALDGAGGGIWFPSGDPAQAIALGALGDLRPSGAGGVSRARALLPLESGEVALLDLSTPGSPELRRSSILSEPLALAAFTPSSGRILVTSRSGRACLLDDPFSSSRAGGTSQ